MFRWNEINHNPKQVHFQLFKFHYVQMELKQVNGEYEIIPEFKFHYVQMKQEMNFFEFLANAVAFKFHYVQMEQSFLEYLIKHNHNV